MNNKINYYEEIRENLINNEVYKKVKDYSKNRSDLETYYRVGKLLAEAGKHYGEGIIKEYSKKLSLDLGKGYTETRLKYYRKFYHVFSNGPTVSDQLSFSHYCEIIWLEQEQIDYYINITIKNRLTIRKLRSRIKSQEYERLPEETKFKLMSKEKINIKDFVPNPIMINNKNNIEVMSEKNITSINIRRYNSFYGRTR